MKGEEAVLIVVDMQNDFCPGGALAVPHGDEIIGLINALSHRFQHVLLTQDWHPKGHISFASSHPGHKPYDQIEVSYGMQVLWPDHCVQNTQGARIVEDLRIPHAEMIIRKGFYSDIDSYSAFLEADRKKKTGLAGYLKERGFKKIYCVGLATDFCVSWTALDAAAEGFETYIIEDVCRGIDIHGSLDVAKTAWRQAGIHCISTHEL